MGTLLNRRRCMGGGAAPLPNWFRLTAIEDSVFTLTIPSQVTASQIVDVSYSIDEGTTWVTTSNSSSAVTITTPQVMTGDSVIWKGHASQWGVNNYNFAAFTSTGKFNVSGLISYLFTESKTSPTQKSRLFSGMFYGSSNLVSAKDLEIPDIPQTTSSNSHICAYMFQNCTSLTTSPTLQFKSLMTNHFLRAFQGCSQLSSITMLATSVSANNCLYSWTNGVAASGTFTKASGVTIPSGVNGIPNGWTVVEV